MKKLFVLLIVLAALFSFSTGAFAQTRLSSLCNTTTGTLLSDQSDQGMCTYSDFQTGYGYCLAGKSVYSNKAIFSICFCPEFGSKLQRGFEDWRQDDDPGQ